MSNNETTSHRISRRWARWYYFRFSTQSIKSSIQRVNKIQK